MPISAETKPIQLEINAKPVSVRSDPKRSLLEVLREDLHLTGTKYGCGEGACGACCVLVDGRPVFSCTTPLQDVAGKSLRTIEALSDGQTLHPVQQAFLDAGGFQCGFCTPGMILATVALLEGNAAPDEQAISAGLDGHICRCCSYITIAESVRRAAELSRKGEGQ